MLYLFNKNEKEIKTKQKIILISLSIIFLISIITFLYLILKPPIPSRYTIKELKPSFTALYMLSISLSIIAYISCLAYYISTKNNNYFLVSLIYLNLSIVNALHILNDYNHINFLNSIFRIMIMFLIIRDNSWIKNKFISISLVILSSIILTKLDFIIFLNQSIVYKNLYDLIIGLLLIANLIFAIIFSKMSYKECDFLYLFMIASLLALSLRGISYIDNSVIYSEGIYISLTYRKQFFMIFCFIMVICGVFFEVIRLINNKNNLEKELNIFYDITELNKFNNILLFNKNGHISYANKYMLDTFAKGKNLKEKYNYIYKGIKSSDNEVFDFKYYPNHMYSYKVYSSIINSYFDINIQRIFLPDSDYYDLVSFKDITDEYLLNIACSKNEELLTSINDNIQDLIIGIDNNGIIKYLNKSAINILKFKHDDILEMNYFDLFLDSYSYKDFLSQTGIKHNYKVKNKIHEIINLESIVIDLQYLKHSSISKVIISKDLTQKNNLDNLKLKYNEIKAYDKSKNEFFANLSHELKTPLNIIYSTVQLFEKVQDKDSTVFKEFYMKYKSALRLNCLRMMRLVNNLIDITKADDNSIDINFVNLNIIEFVENIASSIIPYARMKNLNIIFDTNTEEAFIKCDPEKIERILLNLLSNAIKFTPEYKNIYIDILVNKEWINIYVKDEGIGIPNTMKNLIFERFVQLDKSLNRNTEGSGIGLSIVKSLIDLHDGKINLESYEGKGTTFKISLPNKSLSYQNISNNLVNYSTESDRIELELSDIYEVF